MCKLKSLIICDLRSTAEHTGLKFLYILYDSYLSSVKFSSFIWSSALVYSNVWYQPDVQSMFNRTSAYPYVYMERACHWQAPPSVYNSLCLSQIFSLSYFSLYICHVVQIIASGLQCSLDLLIDTLGIKLILVKQFLCRA